MGVEYVEGRCPFSPTKLLLPELGKIIPPVFAPRTFLITPIA
jgi:hypothetical protein